MEVLQKMPPLLLARGLFVLAGLLALGGPGAVRADDALLIELADTKLKDVREMRDDEKVGPSLKDFSPARAISLAAPADDHYYTVAYQSEAGCVIFFSPLGKNDHDLAIKWEGEQPCDGKPVSGNGTLHVKYQTDTKDKGTVMHASEFKGKFEGGMLTTAYGFKINYVFAADGALLPDINRMVGRFKYGLLQGAGVRTWSGAESAHPSMVREKGRFNEGDPVGNILVTRLHPYPGVEADSLEVVLNDKGQMFQYQAYNNKPQRRVVGEVWFYGGDESCMTRTDEYKGSPYMPLRATLVCSWEDIRGDMIMHVYTYEFDCDEWQIAEDRWTCPKGTIVKVDDNQSGLWHGETRKIIRDVKHDKAYYVPVPFNRNKPYQSD